MRTLSRVLLYLAGGFVALALLAIVALPLLLNRDASRAQLQAWVSSAAEMQVEIAGPLQVRVLPSLQLVANDVRIGRNGEEYGSADSVVIGMELLPLLQRDVQIRHIELSNPVLSLERYPDGRFNIESDEDDKGPLSQQRIDSINVSNATVHYLEGQAGSMYQAKACNGDAESVILAAGSREDFFRNLSLQVAISCDELTRNEFAVNSPAISLSGQGGVFTIDPFTLDVFAAIGTGSLIADVNGEHPHYELVFSLPQFQSAAVLDAMQPESSIAGSLDFDAMLTFEGTTVDAITASMNGTLSLHGEDLALQGIALDEELARFESTQNFNIVDMGALFFAGPLGLVVTKGYDYANLAQQSGSSSQIRELVSEWAVANGVARAEDVAMATEENRLAVSGSLDFNTGEFADMKMAVVDDEGCATIEQAIHGSFREPVIDKPGILQSLAAPALSLVQQGLELLPGGEEDSCEPFYSGSLQAE